MGKSQGWNGRTASTLIEPYRFSIPFPFVSTLTRKRFSIPARFVCRDEAREDNIKKHLIN